MPNLVQLHPGGIEAHMNFDLPKDLLISAGKKKRERKVFVAMCREYQ
jgi:hypothetical protein